jgi:hypothetical protein
MEPEAPEPRHSDRIRGGVAKPKKYALATMQSRQHGRADKVKAAEIADIKQVFNELEALEPVEKRDLPGNVKPLGSHLFTVEKFMADWQHDKFKSHLVSHDNE